MRACVQRVREASVEVDGQVVGEIGHGLLVLLGVGKEDTEQDAGALAERIVGLRIFADDAGKMNRSLADINGAMLVVSQFTLFGDCRKGRRPSFIAAAEPAEAERLYLAFVSATEAQKIEVATGQFRAMMDVALVNEGPVTMLLDSHKLF